MTDVRHQPCAPREAIDHAMALLRMGHTTRRTPTCSNKHTDDPATPGDVSQLSQFRDVRHGENDRK